MLLIVEQPAEE